MARVDFDDSVYKDPNFSLLLLKVGCLYKTKGLLLSAWELAQLYWREHKGVPYDKWPEAMNALIEFKFARLEQRGEDAFVYVAGSKERCAFIDARAEAGAKGGRKASTRHRDEAGKFKKSSKQTPSNIQANAKQHLDEQPSKTKQNQPSYSVSVSDSSPVSVSSTDSELTPLGQKTKSFIAAYILAFKAKYQGASPIVDAKGAGIAKRVAKALNADEIESYVAAYFQMPDAWLHKIKHPITAFESKLNEITVYMNSGDFTTQAQVRDLDATATNMQLLLKIREKEANNEPA